MTQTLSRREFLRAAGGVTFLALTPVGRGLFAAVDVAAPAQVPLFTALPYLQSGPEGRIIPGNDSARLAWQTEPLQAAFVVEFGRDATYGQRASIIRTERHYGHGLQPAGRYNYVCTFGQLASGQLYHYRVRCNDVDIIKGHFTTRQTPGTRIRFAAFGDSGCDNTSNPAIAYQVYQAYPDFIMNTGDNVYDCGRDDEYRRYFFPVYNADTAAPDVGGPLLRSVPFYTVLGNHDLNSSDPNGRHTANFEAFPDALSYYTNFHLPLNGHLPHNVTTTYGPYKRLEDFKACAGGRFPRMANYAFDWGDAHFLCLDSNTYVDPTDAALQAWIRSDLESTKAIWKFVVHHQPAFCVGRHHYPEQQFRALAPLFEHCGVDFVLNGHEHCYQRNVPLRFAPTDLALAHALHSTQRYIPGTFTLDRKFDGIQHTRPDGVIYLITGAGGQDLQDGECTNAPDKWINPEDDYAPHCARMIADRFSFSLFEIDGAELNMRQIDDKGAEIDCIRVTKA